MIAEERRYTVKCSTICRKETFFRKRNLISSTEKPPPHCMASERGLGRQSPSVRHWIPMLQERSQGKKKSSRSQRGESSESDRLVCCIDSADITRNFPILFFYGIPA